MEMHQVRYFLAVARELNFTRAAEQCHVSQPALTRAVQQLEEELGGKLLHREGKLSHLTDLGERMLPLMTRCLESALAAKSLASSFKAGSSQALLLALAPTIDLGPLAACLQQIERRCRDFDFKILRGAGAEIGEYLKKGQAELAVAGPIEGSWDRLDSHHLYEERLVLAVSRQHKLAGRPSLPAHDLGQVRVLLDSSCGAASGVAQQLEQMGAPLANALQVPSHHDVISLIEANLGAGFLPPAALVGRDVAGISIEGLNARRVVSLYTVAGRPRSIAADALIKMLRARDWSPERA
jgi:DNA-binding transcriptional LysR family regulator